MAKKLYLLRHARASEKLNGETDFDRNLTSVGLQNATRMGINLKNKDIHPDIIISSPAMRAKTTAALLAEQIKYDVKKIHLNEEIYEASARTLLKVINNLKKPWQTVLLVGHNPSLSYVAEYITNEPIGNMSTCGLVEIQFEEDTWEVVSENNGTFNWYEYPELLNF